MRDRHRAGEEDVLLGRGGGRRVLAEKPARQPRRILEADAAVAEVALVLCEELLLRRVVEIDAVAVGKVELEVAERIGGPGALADVNAQLARCDGLPVDAVGVKHARIGAEGGKTS